jgi:hypothetical protein
MILLLPRLCMVPRGGVDQGWEWERPWSTHFFAARAHMTKIAAPGVYHSLSMEDYHSDVCVGPSISSSGLRTIFSKSPAHYWVESPLNPNRIEPKETEAFTLGRAAHHLLLGEDDFSTLFIVRPDELGGKPWQGNRTECKAWCEKHEAAGRTVLKGEQIEQVRGMGRSLAAHPLVAAGILNGDIEQSIIFQDKATGVYVKVRPDAIPNSSGDFADLKTSADIGDELDRAVSSYRYDMQAALTGLACREVLGREMTSFSFVFVEKTPPHCVDVLTLAPDDIELAEKDLRVALDTFAWCLESGNWFGPGGHQSDARFVRISEWAKQRAEYRRDFLRREIAASPEPIDQYVLAAAG